MNARIGPAVQAAVQAALERSQLSLPEAVALAIPHLKPKKGGGGRSKS